MRSLKLASVVTTACGLLLVSSAAVLAVSGTAAGATQSITVTPNTNLSNGTNVKITGSGFHPTKEGAVLECNDTKTQPKVTVAHTEMAPVGCSDPLSNLIKTTAGGTVSGTFTVIEGTVGPPAKGTDSSSGTAAVDAAKYPCPPTATQLAKGVSCNISYGTETGLTASVDITFTGQSPPASTTTVAGATTTTASGATTTTAAGSTPTTSHTAAAAGATTTTAPSGSSGSGSGSSDAGSLAFTGPGPGVWILALAGILLLNMGFLVMTLYYRPREIAALAGRRVARIFGAGDR